MAELRTPNEPSRMLQASRLAVLTFKEWVFHEQYAVFMSNRSIVLAHAFKMTLITAVS